VSRSSTAHSLPASIGMAQVVHLAWPIVVSMLSYTAMSVADTLFVSQLGTAQLASIGLALSMHFTLHSFGDGILTGLKVAVAQRTGADDGPAVDRLLWLGLWLALGMGLIEASLALTADVAFTIQGASPEAAAHASSYFGVRVLGGPLAFGTYALSSWLQGRGETRLPMIATLAANATNIALDPLLIHGLGPVPGMGVAGAAAATVVAYGVSFAILATRLRRRIARSPKRPTRALLGLVTRLGLPLGLRASLHVGSFAVFAAILSQVGDDHLAAHVLTVRIISVSFLPGMGIGEACSILAGQLIGARRGAEIADVRRHGLRLAAGLMAVCGVVFIVIPEPLVSVFDPSPTVFALALDLLVVAAAFQVFDAACNVFQGVLNGAGDTRFVMLAGVTTQWLIMLPVGWALAMPAGLGSLGAWLGLTVEIVCFAAITWWRVRRRPWARDDETGRVGCAAPVGA